MISRFYKWYFCGGMGIKSYDAWWSWYNVTDFIAKWTGYKFVKHNIVRPIIRVAQWVPVLWFNYDFDSHYMIVVLAYKLKRLRKALLNGHGVIIDPKRSDYKDEAFARQRESYFRLVKAYHLAKRIAEDKYYDAYVSLFVRHYGGMIEHDMKSFPSETNKGYYEMDFVERYNKIRPELVEIAKKVYKRYGPMKFEDYHRNKDVEELFDLVKNHYREWWD